MSTPRPAAGPASASGVRRSGDNFQDLLAWVAAMRVIQAGSDVHQLEMEINGVGNVDDVVLRRTLGGDSLGQAKWATTTASKVDESFLTERPSKGRSLLQKFCHSYQLVRNPDRPPTLELLTNRGLDEAHPLLGHVDGRSDLLVPYAADAPADGQAGQALQIWADHVGVSREALLEVLEHLTFRTGLTVSSERDRAQVLMNAAGLRHDAMALAQGLAAVAEWVQGGRRTLTPDDIHHLVDGLGLHKGHPRAILLVQAIDRDTHPEDALETLDWVDWYDGDAPGNRVQPLDPSGWSTMAEEVGAAAGRLEAAGWTDILVRGAMRQATAFLVGTALPDVRRHRLHYMQRGQEWSTDATRVVVPQIQTSETHIGGGADLAVVVSIAADASRDVARYLTETRVPVAELVSLAPTAGAHDQVVTGPGQAIAYAQQFRQAAREAVSTRPGTEKVHLFLAGPGGLALLLGHRWNRVRPTLVYEHLGTGRGYTPAFEIPPDLALTTSCRPRTFARVAAQPADHQGQAGGA